MKKAFHLSLAAALTVVFAAPAAAWGPKTRLAVVTMATRLVARDGIPLTKLEKDVQKGALISQDDRAKLLPSADRNPVLAIEAEMFLLQAARGERVDPYFAYRLGVLGNTVAEATAPMAGAPATYRDMYYKDVEQNVDVPILPTKRRTVDPGAYFSQVQREAATRQDIIVGDYRDGVGFRGLASQSLKADVGRSVNAVADVMYTILRGPRAVVDISEDRLRDYMVQALEFYIKRGNLAETNRAYDRFQQMNLQTPELQKRVGDMFYDAEQFDRAMKEYSAVLAVSPDQRDVVERIARYYVRLGESALIQGDLEAAQESYESALEADALHPSAQSELVRVKRLIDERNERLAGDQGRNARGLDLEGQADKLIAQGDYAGAMGLLRNAQQEYVTVDTEFPEESNKARTGLNRITDRLTQLRDELRRNVDSFSGIGAAGDIGKMAAAAADELRADALQNLINNRYRDQLAAVEKQYADQMKPGAQP
jgi:tetratricopeptide (TPR) repeat protein